MPSIEMAAHSLERIFIAVKAQAGDDGGREVEAQARGPAGAHPVRGHIRVGAQAGLSTIFRLLSPDPRRQM